MKTKRTSIPKRGTWSGIALATTLVLLAGCGNEPDKTIPIGATLDLTGPNAVYGEQVKQGIDLAIEELNSAGGVNGAPLKILYQDSRSDAKTAVSNAQRFISVDGCKVLIGEISSNATQAMIPVVEQAGAFLFAPASSSPKLTNAGQHFARNWPSDLAEAGSAAHYAWDKLKAQRAAVLFVNNDYGIGLKEKFSATYTGLGGQVVSAESFEVDADDYRTLLLKLKGVDPQAIYLAGNPKEMGRCIKQLREQGIAVPVISCTGFLQTDCLTLAGQGAEGVIVPTPSYDPKDTRSEVAKRFYAAFTAKYKNDPTMVNANGYDAIHLIAEAIRTQGNDGSKIAAFIRNKKDYPGAAGAVSFTDGDVEVPIVFKVIKNGQAETVTQ